MTKLIVAAMLIATFALPLGLAGPDSPPNGGVPEPCAYVSGLGIQTCTNECYPTTGNNCDPNQNFYWIGIVDGPLAPGVAACKSKCAGTETVTPCAVPTADTSENAEHDTIVSYDVCLGAKDVHGLFTISNWYTLPGYDSGDGHVYRSCQYSINDAQYDPSSCQNELA